MAQTKRIRKSRPQTRAYQAAKAALAASAKAAVGHMLVKEGFEEEVAKVAGAAPVNSLTQDRKRKFLFIHPQTQELTIQGRQVLWWILNHPGVNQRQILEEFPCDRGTLSALLSSPAFNREYKEALERVNQHVIGTMVQKLSQASIALLSGIESRAKSGHATELFLVDAGGLVLKSLGFGAESAAPTKVEIGIGNQQPINIMVDGDALNKARSDAAAAFKGASESRLLPAVVDLTNKVV